MYHFFIHQYFVMILRNIEEDGTFTILWYLHNLSFTSLLEGWMYPRKAELGQNIQWSMQMYDILKMSWSVSNIYELVQKWNSWGQKLSSFLFKFYSPFPPFNLILYQLSFSKSMSNFFDQRRRLRRVITFSDYSCYRAFFSHLFVSTFLKCWGKLGTEAKFLHV